MLKTKIISSLEKVFINDTIDKFERLEKVSVLRGERLSFQIIGKIDGTEFGQRQDIVITPTGKLADHVTVRCVDHMIVTDPVIRNDQTFTPFDDNYLTCEPGLFPDILSTLCNNTAYFSFFKLVSVWVDVEIPEDAEAGECTLGFKLDAIRKEVVFEESLTVDVIDATLPPQKTYFTQWFHVDCLANYYGVPTFSEKHWQIIENFAKVAAKNGINMLLTPVFTPPLDTEVGGERLTTQLVKVTKRADRYYFGFKLLDRWIDMCDRVGIKYFEIAHFYTQWGAKHAPKVMATVDGEYKKIFGWETDSLSKEYTEFLRAFLKAFLKHMKKRGDDKRCYFHISDEPSLAHIENYKQAKEAIGDLIADYPIMDAMSNLEYYTNGITKMPIPGTKHIARFIEANVPGLWTYYACTDITDVSNRFIAMPSWRNRSIGMQMYKFGIEGFLQWGYNFYNTIRSVGQLNPYLDSASSHALHAGDAFSVYPATNGEALESLRIVVFHQALQDIRAMQLCEKYYSKAETVKAIEAALGKEISFTVCAKSTAEMTAVREAVNKMIKEAVASKQQ